MPDSGQLSVGAALAAAFALTLALAVAHLLAPRLRRLPGVPERATASFAGGISVAYVFLHLLPELVEGNEAVAEVLGDAVEPTPLLDLAIFAVALAGFTAFYGLDRWARRTAGEHAGGAGPAGFYLHLAFFALYNGLITYTLPLHLRTGVAFGVLFAIALGLHFVLIDRSMEEHHPRRFSAYGRPVLAVALLAGWVLAALFAPTSAVLVALLTAFLGGSVLLNVFKEELPSERRSSFGWFLAGLVVYGGLLALVTVLSE